MKKFLSMLMAVVLMLTLAASSALAEIGPKSPKGPAKKEHHITQKVDKQQEKQLKKLEQMVDKANRDIEKAVRTAQRTPYNDIDWLQAKVAAIVAPVFAYAESIGATVQCTYTTYYIDGQYVDVDPLRVINVR